MKSIQKCYLENLHILAGVASSAIGIDNNAKDGRSERERSNFHVNFTMILCATNFPVYQGMKLYSHYGLL